jgi:hypothetical protein
MTPQLPIPVSLHLLARREPKNQHDGLLYLRSLEAGILCVSLYPTVTRAHLPAGEGTLHAGINNG